MANTTNLGLVKITGTEKLKTFPTTFNDNMDDIDGAFGESFGGDDHTVSEALEATAEAIAIMANNNTHVAIASGQYVYVRNHGTLAEGLYKATVAISANATLSGENLTAVSNGGLNEIQSRKAVQILLNADNNTIAQVYEILNGIGNISQTATIYMTAAVLANITNNALSAVFVGTVSRATSSNFKFVGMVGGNKIVAINQQNMSSSSWGTSTITDVDTLINNATNMTKGATGSFGTAMMGYGICTSSAKTLMIYFPVPKIVQSGGTFTLTSLKLRVRGVSGHVDIFTSTNNELIGTENYTFSLDLANYGRCFVVRVDKTTALTNATNETPVVVSGTFKFNATWS